ncbi:MAG TPA: TIGR03560 family F420-dependent LLM class oxidoreductase [Candidatus Limnocylindrales bacterium]|nr:TIGR03560 family F420-dependent LLM class oxidoreductase [Candidatus Limnocylindrales bacterium]
MRLALMCEPQQGLRYVESLALARAAETARFEALFRSDHYLSFPGDSGRPTTDAWATLAGLARETATIRLGALVSPITFRLPGPFAKLVTTIDEMAGGRIEAGLGAGWNEAEHRAHGIPFPPLRERYDRLEESLAVIHGLWTEPDGWSRPGRWWSVEGAVYRPSPAIGERRHPHLIVGGDGKPRGLRLAATYADEYNISSVPPERTAEVREALRATCADVGRDPAQVAFSAMVGVLVGRDEADLRERTSAVLAAVGAAADARSAEAWLAERRPRWIIGTPDEAVARIEAFAAAGVERIMLQDFLPWDLDQVALLGREILPRVA